MISMTLDCVGLTV